MIVFALWGVGRTVPYVGIYRVDALRDAVIWGYCVFAILTALFLRAGHLTESVPARYARFLPWLLVWGPIGLALSRAIGDHVPTVPGTRVS
jgi:hypothetical protein